MNDTLDALEMVVNLEATDPHEQVRNARRAMGLTQAQLASETASSQSAISMFEAGRTDAVSEKTLARIVERLGLSLQSCRPAHHHPAPELLKWKACPIDDCPSNIPYVVRGQLCAKPSLVQTPASDSTRCGYCGEILISSCPNPECNADIQPDDSFCRKCGTAYVPPARAFRGDVEQWATEQRVRIEQLRSLSSVRRFGA